MAQCLSTKVLTYSEEANADGAPADSLRDLTKGRWAVRVVMVDPLLHGDYLDLMTEIVLQCDRTAAAYEAEFGAAIDLEGAANAGEKFIMDLSADDVILVGSTDDVSTAVNKLS